MTRAPVRAAEIQPPASAGTSFFVEKRKTILQL
jgi:hypothetical protein